MGCYGVVRAQHLDMTLFVATYVYVLVALQSGMLIDVPDQQLTSGRNRCISGSDEAE